MYIMCFHIQFKWLYKEPHRYAESVSGSRHSELYHYNSSLFEKIVLLWYVYVHQNIETFFLSEYNIYENY